MAFTVGQGQLPVAEYMVEKMQQAVQLMVFTDKLRHLPDMGFMDWH
jgi:hypothetical protein